MKVEPAAPIPDDQLAGFVTRRDRLRQALVDGVFEPVAVAEPRLAALGGETGPTVPAAGS